jgi:SAM-dependent methyltransferase
VLRGLARLPFLAVRRLRWWRGSWSKDSDRTYHERLYEAQDYDPFDPGYPGYPTIRRFADHAEALLPASGTVLDLGCGPGEITCELARRHPSLAFLGLDHSAQAIRRATANASRLGLRNVRFEVGDAERLPAGERYGLVTMFDAFHHLEDPRAFIGWLTSRTSRCLLIEPAGTWSGRWARGVDVDWLLVDLASIRDRLEAICGAGPDVASPGEAPGAGLGAAESPAAPAGSPAAPAGSPLGLPPARGEGAVERRYALDDFARFFAGWDLRITGTIAGVDRYPPAAHARSPLRPIAGDVAYALLRATDALLLERGRDGAAKHWVIAATTEAGVIAPRLPPTTEPARVAAGVGGSRVAGACDVRYANGQGPARLAPGAESTVAIDIANDGWDEWRSDGPNPVHVSYHWLTRTGAMVDFDGLRSDLPRPLAPGETARATVVIRAPGTPGAYLLAIDLVREGVTWFSEAGAPYHTASIEVR